MSRPHRCSLLVLSLALLTTGCTSFDDELTRKVLDEVMASRLDVLAWAAAWRSFVFGLLGLFVGLGLFFGLRARELLRLRWRHAKWVRAVAGVLIVLGAASTGAWWGFWTGSMRAAETIVREGQLGTEVLPAAGDAGSMLVASVYVGSELAEGKRPIDEDVVAARVAAYVKGEWSMPADRVEAVLANVRGQVLGIATDVAKQQVFARYPALAGTLADQLIPWALDKLTAKLGEKAVEAASESETAAMFLVPAQEVLSTLDEAAEREGDPDMLAHAELRMHVVEVGLVPMILGPIEHMAKSQRKLGLIGFLLLMLVVVGGIRLADYLIVRRSGDGAITT